MSAHSIIYSIMATPYFSDDRCIEVYVKRAPALRKAACDVTEVREAAAAAAGASSRPPRWSGPLKRVSSASLPQSHSLALSGPFRERAHLSYMAFSEEIGSKELCEEVPLDNFFSDAHK